MKYDNIAIDLNNLFWRSVVDIIKMYKDDENADDLEFYSCAIETTLKRLNEIVNRFGKKTCTVYVLSDNPFSKINERESIDENYKHARKSKNIPKIFYKTLENLILILKEYNDNYYHLSYPGTEADDLVPFVIDHMEGTLVLISADLDWARSISDEGVHWFNFKEIFDPISFENEYGFNPTKNGVKIYKSIHGDTSDSIDNIVPHIPKKVLNYIANYYITIDELLKNMWTDDNIPHKWKLKIKEVEVQLRINYQLVDFIIPEATFEEVAYKCKEDIEHLKNWFNMMDVPFENRMIDESNRVSKFFEKKKIKRYYIL